MAPAHMAQAALAIIISTLEQPSAVDTDTESISTQGTAGEDGPVTVSHVNPVGCPFRSAQVKSKSGTPRSEAPSSGVASTPKGAKSSNNTAVPAARAIERRTRRQVRANKANAAADAISVPNHSKEESECHATTADADHATAPPVVPNAQVFQNRAMLLLPFVGW